jgi:electron transfer flavoprotein alpha subunit
VITVRGTAFEKAAAEGGSGTIEPVGGGGDKGLSAYVGSELSKSERPELTSAKIIVSGGRAFGSSEQFHALLDPLADKLKAGVGASAAPRSTPAMRPTTIRSARPARSSPPKSISRSAFRARSSTLRG